MSTLTFRAERALLGAMLRIPGLTAMLEQLETGDFLIAQHRTVHAALAEAAWHPDTGYRWHPWREQVADQCEPEVPDEYLRELEAACPDPGHGHAYATLVMEASARRSLLAGAAGLGEQAQSMRESGRRMSRAGAQGGRQIEAYAEHAGQVARLIRGHAARFSPDTASAVPAPQPVPGAGEARARDEEMVLAALIQRHPQSRIARADMTAEAFTDPVRREIFRAVDGMYRSGRGRDIDPLTVDWQVASAWASAGRQPNTETIEREPGYVTRLAATLVTVRVARTARDLAETRPAVQRGQDAVAEPGQGRRAAARPVNGSPPGTRLIQPPPPGPGRGPGPAQGR